MSNIKISAIICTYNRYSLLEKCVASLKSQSLSEEMYEIIIVDNTTENLIDYDIRKSISEIGNVKYIVESTAGLSNARNVGYKAAISDYIAFIDDDALAKFDWLQSILAAYELFGEKAAIIGGKIVPIWPFPRPPWVHALMLPSLTIIDWGGEARIAQDNEWFAGANISFNKSYLSKVGGFSTSLGRTGESTSLLSNEEVDVVKKIEALGGLRVYAPGSEVSHLVDERRLSHKWFRRRAAWQAISDFIMDPVAAEKYSARSLDDVLEYLTKMPPRERNLGGLYSDKEDPELMYAQINAVYALMISAMSGFKNDK